MIELQQDRVGQRRRSAIVACGGNDENPFKKDGQLQQAEKKVNRCARQVHHNKKCLVGHQAEEKTQHVTNIATNETVRYLTENTMSIGLCREANGMGGNGCCTC